MHCISLRHDFPLPTFAFFKEDRHSSGYLCSDAEAILFSRTCFRGIPVLIWRRCLLCCWSWEGAPRGTSDRTALQEARRGIHSAELRRRGGGICKGCFTMRALPEPSVKFTRKRKKMVETGSFVPLCKLVKGVNFAWELGAAFALEEPKQWSGWRGLWGRKPLRVYRPDRTPDLDKLELAIWANSGGKKSADVWIIYAISTVQVVLFKSLLGERASKFLVSPPISLYVFHFFPS